MGRIGRSQDDGPNEERELRTKHVHDKPRKSTRAEKGKGIASSSQQDAPRRSRSSHPNPSNPWPRRDGKPFSGIDTHPKLERKELVSEPSYENKRKGDGWVRYNSICYNGLLNVDILPTRVLCPRMLEELGILDEVLAVLGRMGFGTMATKQYPLYPELVRQFLASCEVYYEDEGHRIVDEGSLTYVIRGIEYAISLRDLCEIYGFDESLTLSEFPGRSYFRQSDRLWTLIGMGEVTSRSMKLTHIRNPVIRIVAKALGTTIFCKEEPGALRLDELFMLHFGMPEFVSEIYTDYPREQRTNYGAAFAQFLTERKFRGLSGPGKRKQEVCGSLLTPIFQFHGVDVSDTEVIQAPSLLDMQHLIQSRWMIGSQWRYFDLDGTQQSISLPSEHAPLTSMANVRFLPSASPQSTDSGAQLQRRKRRHVRRDADTAGPSSGPAPSAQSYQLPPYDNRFCPSPLRDTWTTSEYRQHQHRTSHKLHSMMAMIWGALSCSRGTDAVTGPDLAGSHMPPPSGPSTDVRPEDADDDDDTDETMVADDSPEF